jgi:CheY-like chemotaxis protein/phosphoribosyl 1,2-cyclic phosphodiesterase
MWIRFWGTRGSLPKPGPSTVRYGGNTSCVEVRGPDGGLIVLDCGSGAHDLGRHLVATGPVRGHLLITHTHWDHIQGFPFFAPLFVPGNEWDVYGPRQVGRGIEEVLAGQMHYPYFPVPLETLAATIRYHELAEETLDVAGVRVTTRYLNHPSPAIGYRLQSGDVTLVYATDHEPHSPHHPEAAGEPRFARVHREDERHIEFLAGADLVIHDAQYTLEEYPARVTWGHTPAELAVDFAGAAHAARLALFHHDPSRTDDALDALLARCRARPSASGMEVFAATEGRELVIEPRGPAAGAPAPAVRSSHRRAPHETTILLVDDDPEVIDLLKETLADEGYRLLAANDGEAALTIAREEHPDMVVLDWIMPKRDGLSVCRALRAEADPRLAEVPVILITGRADAADTAAGFDAGVTDYLTKPFKPSHLLARLEAWLLRPRPPLY